MTDYSFFDLLRNSYSFLFTKILFPKARLIRMPIYIRGKKGIHYESGLTTGHGCRLDASIKKVTLYIGKDARIGDYVHINAEEYVKIGDNILIASKVFISDANHGVYNGEMQDEPFSNPSERIVYSSPVVIGDNVWIGENVVILPGSKIGNGCVIGANSVVNGKEYPDNCILAGAPARIIKVYNLSTQKWERIGEV